jgi:hypothetical protein
MGAGVVEGQMGSKPMVPALRATSTLALRYAITSPNQLLSRCGLGLLAIRRLRAGMRREQHLGLPGMADDAGEGGLGRSPSKSPAPQNGAEADARGAQACSAAVRLTAASLPCSRSCDSAVAARRHRRRLQLKRGQPHRQRPHQQRRQRKPAAAPQGLPILPLRRACRSCRCVCCSTSRR